jgi:hypothetical protein
MRNAVGRHQDGIKIGLLRKIPFAMRTWARAKHFEKRTPPEILVLFSAALLTMPCCYGGVSAPGDFGPRVLSEQLAPRYEC